MTHFWDLQDLRILRGPKMENRSPPGPKLCYLFQAGIPKIGHFGTSGSKNWPNLPGFDLPRGQNSLSHREICLRTTDFGLFEVKIRVLGLGSGVPDPRTGLPEGRFGLPEVKNDLWETQNRSPRPEKSIQFSSFWDEKNCPVFWLHRFETPQRVSNLRSIRPPPSPSLRRPALYALAGHRGP